MLGVGTEPCRSGGPSDIRLPVGVVYARELCAWFATHFDEALGSSFPMPPQKSTLPGRAPVREKQASSAHGSWPGRKSPRTCSPARSLTRPDGVGTFASSRPGTTNQPTNRPVPGAAQVQDPSLPVRLLDLRRDRGGGAVHHDALDLGLIEDRARRPNHEGWIHFDATRGSRDLHSPEELRLEFGREAGGEQIVELPMHEGAHPGNQ